MLYVFGRIVEEEEGIAGVWGTYITCALGGAWHLIQAAAASACSDTTIASGSYMPLVPGFVIKHLQSCGWV